MVECEKTFFPIVRKHVFRECSLMILRAGIRTNQKTCDVKEIRTMEPECEDGLALYEKEMNFYLKLILKS